MEKGQSKTCAYCVSDIPHDAVKCRYCQEYQTGICCDRCCASLPADATVCRYCGSRIAGAAETTPVSIPQLSVRSNPVPTFLFRFRLLPQQVTTDQEKIIIMTPGLFGLWQDSDEIQWGKVAGFSYRTGIFWDRIDIETRGQKPSTILGLDKSDGETLKNVLQKLET